MSTSDEAEAMQWLIENGHMENPYEWSTWTPAPKRRFFMPYKSSFSKKIIFEDVYMRRKKVARERDGWPVWKWTYQYATKKEAFTAKLANR